MIYIVPDPTSGPIEVQLDAPPEPVVSGSSGGKKADDIIPPDDSTSPCEKFYGGIGITLSFKNQISELVPGYPAAKAGLRLNDILIFSEEIRGEPGTYIQLKAIREKHILDFTILREKICYN